MKCLVVLFADKNSHAMFEPLFDGKSAFERALIWAQSLDFIKEKEIAVFTHTSIEKDCIYAAEKAGIAVQVCGQESWNVKTLFEDFVLYAQKFDASDIIYGFADCPFLSREGAKEVFDSHINYSAEYTFADGFPYGFTPEALNAGTAKILNSLIDSNFPEEGVKPVSRTAVFDLIKKDINSFDVETVIPSFDARLFRISLCCASKSETMACTAFYKNAVLKKSFNDFTLDELSKEACGNADVLKTLPAFYNVQISAKNNIPSVYIPKIMTESAADAKMFMDAQKFNRLVKEIADFSGDAVISLSAWGEPLLHPEFIELCKTVLEEDGLSLLIETDGLLVTEELCAALKTYLEKSPECTNVYGKIIWIIRIDAFTQELYAKIHGDEKYFSKAVNSVSILQKYFSGSVYPQFVRMNVNECELENFYRFWSAKESPSGGNHIIQKYSTFCGTLSDEKPADLSPLSRNPCWHIRRDLTVLLDGSVPFCRECINSNIIGNVFTDGIKNVWKKLSPFVKEQMDGKYCDFCGKCDEYYTFNF